MNTADYEKRIQALLVKLTRADEQGNMDDCEPVALTLLAEGRARKDPLLTGVARFYHACYHYYQGDFSASIDELTPALDDLHEAAEWSLLGRCYNMLGLLLDYRGDAVGSVDCFYTGIALTRSNNASMAAAILHQNLSAIFEDAGDYDSALEYRMGACRQLEHAKEDRRYGEMKLLVNAMLLRLYLRQGQRKNAAAQMKYVQQLVRTYPNNRTNLSVLIYETEYEHYYGSPERASALLAQAEAAFHRCPSLLDYLDDCISLAKCLADVGQHEHAMEVLDKAEAIVNRQGGLGQQLQLQLLGCRIECCQMWGEAARTIMAQALESYYAISRESRQDFNKTRRKLMRLRHMLESSRLENEKLARRAGTDDLTGLPNRRRLGEVQDQWFDRAQHQGASFGVGMVDIDNFKHLNDTYGHAGGDRCLIFLAALLADAADEHQFVARYGGDEFLILYYGLTDAQILARAERMRSMIQSQSAAQGCGPFTISQGIRNSVPTKGNRVWDYTAAADDALYDSKREGRNIIRLVHSRKVQSGKQ